MLHGTVSNGCHTDARERCGDDVGCHAEDGEVMGERIGELYGDVAVDCHSNGEKGELVPGFHGEDGEHV